MACNQLRTNVQDWPEARQPFQQAKQCLNETGSDISDIQSALADIGIGTGTAATNDLHFEAYLKATSGIVYARLYNMTTSTAVANTQIETSNTSLSLVRATNTMGTLTTGHVYRAQVGKAGLDGGVINGARTVGVGS
jgi:hypothetical protein